MISHNEPFFLSFYLKFTEKRNNKNAILSPVQTVHILYHSTLTMLNICICYVVVSIFVIVYILCKVCTVCFFYLQSDQINMAVLFWYLVNSDLFCVRYCTEYLKSHFLKGTRNTRPWITGQPVHLITLRNLWDRSCLKFLSFAKD